MMYDQKLNQNCKYYHGEGTTWFLKYIFNIILTETFFVQNYLFIQTKQ